MRMRSPMTENHLYPVADRHADRRPGRSSAISARSTPSAPRRLLRLVMLLVLVLLVMRQAGDPAVYRDFFAALDAPLADDAAPRQNEPPSDNRSPRDPLATSPATEPPAKDFAGRPRLLGTVEGLGDAGRRRLARWLAEDRRGDAPRDGADFQKMIAALASAAAQSDEIDPEMLRAAILAGAEGDTGAGRTLRRLQQALDAVAMRGVSDATVWQPEDALPFYRLLELSASPDAADQIGDGWARVGYVSLVDQPRAYRGRRVALDGRVAKVESLTAEENPFGVARYWLVWIRPNDGSDRPVMAYTADLSPGLATLEQETLMMDGPPVRVRGVFMRRHLYQSAKGGELAPVIVGRVDAEEGNAAAARGRANGLAPAGPSPLARSNANGPGADGLAPNGMGAGGLGMLIAVATTVGIGATLLVAWATARGGYLRRRVRERVTEDPREFLSTLASPGPPPEQGGASGG